MDEFFETPKPLVFFLSFMDMKINLSSVVLVLTLSKNAETTKCKL